MSFKSNKKMKQEQLRLCKLRLGTVYEAVFIFEVLFIFELIFIFEVIFSPRLSSFLWSSSF